MLTWAKVAYWLLKLANAIYNGIQEDKLIAIGEDRQNAKMLAVLAENARILREVDEKHDKMSDADVKAQLEQNGDFRD